MNPVVTVKYAEEWVDAKLAVPGNYGHSLRYTNLQ